MALTPEEVTLKVEVGVDVGQHPYTMVPQTLHLLW